MGVTCHFLLNFKQAFMNNRQDHPSTEDSRNYFHPGTILALIVGLPELSPGGKQEVLELISHFLGYTREYANAYRDSRDFIPGFYSRWIAKIPKIAPTLAVLYPDLAQYAEQLNRRGFLDDCIEDAEVRDLIFKEIEEKFGFAEVVLPSGVSIRPVSVAVLDLEPEKSRKWSVGMFQPAPKTNKGIFPPIKTTTPIPGGKK